MNDPGADMLNGPTSDSDAMRSLMLDRPEFSRLLVDALQILNQTGESRDIDCTGEHLHTFKTTSQVLCPIGLPKIPLPQCSTVLLGLRPEQNE